MKNLIKTIILLSLLFSIQSNTFAKEPGYIENLIDMTHGIEAYDIELESLNDYSFNNSHTNYVYNTFKSVTEILKRELIRQYRAGELDYYQTKGIITNYKNFIYYSNKYFYFKKLKEYYPNSKSLDQTIMQNFTYLKSYYMRIKFLSLK